MRQKGFSSIPLLVPLLILSVIAAGYYFNVSRQKASVPTPSPFPSPSLTLSPIPTLSPTPKLSPTPNQEKFAPGEILLNINAGTRYGDVMDLINSFNLKYGGVTTRGLKPDDIVSEITVVVLVYVPKGEEQKWIEIFKSKPIIRSAELNYIVHAI